ncbi:MAG: hypothetical protein ABIR36_14890 [Nitrospiraceae bacterium]
MYDVPRLDDLLQQMIVFVLVVQVGVLIVYGAWKRWKILIAPPEHLWMFVTQSSIKKAFGQNGLVAYLYFVGWIFIIAGIAGLAYRLAILGRGLGYFR